ncbi:MAG: hypothetical protein HUU20_14475 [Pirellulales bacterium]|nr:hypothetical protein [Pirellulales bacterium]
MTIHASVVPVVFLALAAHTLSPQAADESPVLRKANYLAILPGGGPQRQVSLKAQQVSPAYSDALNFTLIGPDSSTITAGEVLLGEERLLSIPGKPEGLHVLELDSGWNACRVDPRGIPSAMVARETVPLHTARGAKQLFFYVPRGCKQFSVWLVADAPREGARIEIAGPDGGKVVEEEGDYDKPQRVRATVPAGCDGKVWSLALVKPKAGGLNVDDVVLWLDPALPPYLSMREDWALTFGKRKGDGVNGVLE